MPTTASIGMGFLTGTDADAGAKSTGWAVGAYVQDQWSVSHNLLLTLGLRWDGHGHLRVS